MSEKVFKQSITRFGSILRPDRLIITDSMVMWKKRNRNLINNDTKSFEIEKITSVEIDSTLIGTSITIRTIAGDKLEIEKFTLSDANEIKSLIHKKQNSIKVGYISTTITTTQDLDTSSIADEIIKLKGLMDSGVITQNEFDKIKQRLISK